MTTDSSASCTSRSEELQAAPGAARGHPDLPAELLPGLGWDLQA